MVFSQNQRYWLVFYPPLFRAVLRTPRKGIRFSILGSWSVVDSEINAGQFLSPAGLSSIQHFCCCEVFQVLVVRVDLDLVSRPLAVPSPVFESLYHCQKFFVVDFVVDLCWLELSGVEHHWM